jgi:hypothetical protein
MNTCSPGPLTSTASSPSGGGSGGTDTLSQGLTLVHFSAQLERFSCDRGCE